jgi:hypothetical protein
MSQATIDAYVASITAIAEADGVLSQLVGEFAAVVRAIDNSDDLRNKLSDELLPISVRQNIVEKLLDGKGHRVTAQCVALVVGAGHGRDLRTIAEKISSNSAHAHGREVAKCALPLLCQMIRPSVLPKRLQKQLVRKSISPSLSTRQLSVALLPPLATRSLMDPSVTASTS